ncbi:hypothetical protein CBM2626_A40016 [Cupriavidus taiwanensis]|nr:hypothetical protein CBM2626_A40016 [Cupriavidus taiwanensis]
MEHKRFTPPSQKFFKHLAARATKIYTYHAAKCGTVFKML